MKFKPEIPSAAYNTNNAWGFGGSYGTKWTFPNGFTFHKGKACFRHLPCERIEFARNETRQIIPLCEFEKACAEWIL